MIIKSVLTFLLLVTIIETRLVVKRQLLTSTSDSNSTTKPFNISVEQNFSESETNKTSDENFTQPIESITDSVTVQKNDGTTGIIKRGNITREMTTNRGQKLAKRKIPNIYIEILAVQTVLVVVFIICWIVTTYYQYDQELDVTIQTEDDKRLSTDTKKPLNSDMSSPKNEPKDENILKYSVSTEEIASKINAEPIESPKLKEKENPTVPEKQIPTTDAIKIETTDNDPKYPNLHTYSNISIFGMTVEEEKRLKDKEILKSNEVLNEKPINLKIV